MFHAYLLKQSSIFGDVSTSDEISQVLALFWNQEV